MAVKAGTTITTAHLSHSTKQAQLSDDVASSTNTWEQWGTEEIVFSDPGIDVEVSAVLIGRWVDGDQTNAAAACRLRISLDGGSNWTTGDGMFVRVGTDVGQTVHAANTMAVSGTPDGDIIVQAEFRVNQTSSEVQDGTITATMVPA